MSRAKWKIIKFSKNKTQSRFNLITPNFLNKEIIIHNGREFKNVIIGLDQIGHKFGEFIFTKIVAKYKTNVK